MKNLNWLKINNERGDGMSGWIIGIGLVLLVLVVLFVAGGDSSGNSNNQGGGGPSKLQVEEKLYDFGTISMAKGKVDHLFKVSNPTDKEINLKTVTTSCMCTNAYIVKNGSERGPFSMPGMGYVPPSNETIKPGELIDIKVVYDPNAHGPSGVGSIDRFVYLKENDGSEIQLEIKATVTP